MTFELSKFIIPWQNDVVRSENISSNDPFHFFYAINNGFQKFRKMTINDRQKYITQQRKEIANKIKKEEWINYINDYRDIIHLFETFFLQKKVPDGFSSIQYDIIFKIIPDHNIMYQYAMKNIDMMGEKIRENIIREFMTIFGIYLDDIEKNEQKRISEEKKMKCCTIFKYYIEQLLEIAENDVFKEFVKDVRDPYKNFDLYYIPFIISHLPFQVYFIEEETKDIISVSPYYDEILLKQKYDVNIVLLYRSPLNFNSLGIMEYNGDNAIIHWQFKNDHELIHKCHEKMYQFHKNPY